MRRLIDGDDVNARDEQSTGAAQEEHVTICEGTSKEGTQEGVGEWKPGIAGKAGQVCWWLRSAEVALTVSDVLLVLSSLSTLLLCASVSLFFSQ